MKGSFSGVIAGTISGTHGSAGPVTQQASTYRTASTATFEVAA